MYRILTQCRACSGPIRQVVSLGHTPLANSLMATRGEAMSLPKFPLNLCVCEQCSFVQLDVAIDSKVLFEHYVYVTPNATSLQSHYDSLIAALHAYPFKKKPLSEMNTVEMGSNNGAFLRVLRPHVKRVVGIEPAKNIAAMATADGIPTIPEFFMEEAVPDLLDKTGPVDLFVARHCMAHLDDLRGTLRAIAAMLSDDGIVVIENAYLKSTLDGGQFDQLYHEHMSYFALQSLSRLMRSCGLQVQHAHIAPVHGGSIVVIASKAGGPVSREHDNVWNDEEWLSDDLQQFAFMTRATVGGLRAALDGFIGDGATIYTYGATAKGNTLLNATGLTWREVKYAVDSTPLKHGRFLPGSGIQVVSEDIVSDRAPTAFLLTAWNYAEEILAKQESYRKAGGRFILPLPTPRLMR